MATRWPTPTEALFRAKIFVFLQKILPESEREPSLRRLFKICWGGGVFFLVYRQIFLRLSTRWPTAAAPLRRARGRGTTEGTGALYIEKTGKTSLKLKKTVDCPFKSERPIPLAARGSPIWPPTPTPRWRPYFFPARAPPLEELSPSLRRYWLRGRGPAPFWSQAPPLSGCSVSSRRKPRPPL